MKISEMLKREDFYAINKATLNDFYEQSECGNFTDLYIYPKLNAIITATPGKQVKEYLLSEFTLQSRIKCMIAHGYVRMCLASKGTLADNKVRVKANIDNNTLIYPCNKKYRIFDFNAGVVSVIIKNGFDRHDLEHEIDFRKSSDVPEFVPRMTSWSSRGYTEKIINGRPIVRSSDIIEFENIRKKAYYLFRNYYKKSDTVIDCKVYLKQLESIIIQSAAVKNNYNELLENVVSRLKKYAACAIVPLGFSHGDLQPGNIWITSLDKRILIIDWESWGRRSIWYDYATLFHGLRPGGVQCYFNSEERLEEKAIVLLEDIIFQLNEANSMPRDQGKNYILGYLQRIHDCIV